MSSFTPAPDILSLLYGQHRAYTAELGRTHQVLSKLYKKIAKAEQVLAERERQERQLTRSERKKLQWTRVQTKQTIRNMEMQQGNLHDALRQSQDLITSFEHLVYNNYNSNTAPTLASWTTTGHCDDPPSPYLFSPLSPAFTPSTPVAQHRPSVQNWVQYWDLSSLPEKTQASPSPYGADSGFHEPQILGQNAVITKAERLITNSMLTAAAADDNDDVQIGPPERKIVPDHEDLVSPMTSLGASDISAARSHKRCVSANAVQLNLGDLAPPSTKRGISVGPVPDRRERIIPASGLMEK